MTAAHDLTVLAQTMRQYRRALRPRVSQFTLGEILGWDERTVRRAESGTHQPSAGYLRRWLQWFRECGGTETAADEIANRYDRVASTIDLSWWPHVWGTLGKDGLLPGYEDPSMKRRALLTGGLALSAGAALEAGQTVKDYEHLSQALRRAYSRTPARLLLPQVTATLTTLEHELPAVGEVTRQRLLRPYAELHLLAAWTARWDLMDSIAAGAHNRLAAHAAHQAGDTDLLAHTFALHSYICRWGDRTERVREAVQAAEEACRLVPTARPASVSYVNVVAAEVYGETGDEVRTLEHLDTARVAATGVKPGSMWCGSGLVWDAHRMVSYEAYALRAIGRPDEAYEVFSASDVMGKRGGVRALNLAETLFALGEVESATKQATCAYQLAQSGQHASVLSRTRRLYAKLSTYDSLPAVRDLGELIRA